MANNLDLSLRIRVNADGSAQVINNTTRQIDRMGDAAQRTSGHTQTFSSRLHSAAAGALNLNSAVGALAGGLSVMALYFTGKELISYADSLKLIDARVKVATSSIADYAAANKALLAVSLESHSSLAENANLFARTNKSIEQMGGTIGNTIAFTDTLAKSLKLSGASQIEAASVTRQMAQAFASGVLRGDEFNSIMENGSRLAYALATGLGVGVGELRKMAEGGELTAPKVLTAVLSESQAINEEFKTLPVTVAAAMQDISTAFGVYLNAANTTSNTTSNLAAVIGTVAQNLTPIIDMTLLLGEAFVLSFVTKGITSLTAFIGTSIASARATAANTAMTAAHSQALIMDAQRTAAATAATVASIQAQIAQTQATLAGTTSMTARMAVTNTLNLQTQALTAATIASAQAQTALNATIAANTTSLSAMAIAMGAVNAAISLFMGYQFGTWLYNNVTAAANLGTYAIGMLKEGLENLGYSFEYVKVAASGNHASLDALKAQHQANLAAINENIMGLVEWREQQDKGGKATNDLRNYLLSIKSPLETYMAGVEKANKSLAAAPDLVDNYRRELVRLRNEFERMSDVAAKPFNDAIAKYQDQIDKFRKTELDYEFDKTVTEKGITNQDEKNRLRETIALSIQLREEKEAATKAASAAHKSAVKEAKAEQTEIKNLLKHYDDITLKMREEITLNGDNKKSSALQFEIENTRMDEINPKYRELIESKQLLALQTAAELDNLQLTKKEDELRIQSLENLTDHYKQLTLSAKEYALWKLTPQNITAQEATPEAIGAQFDKNTTAEKQKAKLDDASQSLKSYVDSIGSAKTAMQDLGNVTGAVFDGALGGIHTLVGALGDMSDKLGKNKLEMEELGKQRAANDADLARKEIDKIKYQSNLIAFSKKETQLNKEKTTLEIDSARQLAGAAAGLFGKKTAAAKAFHAVEMGLSVASLAMKASEMAANIPLTLSNIAAGASAMFAQGGFAGFGGVAAMLAVMAGLGFAASGGGNVKPPKVSADKGSVLGDKEASSESIKNITDLLQSIHASEYAELRGINRGVTNLTAALSKTIDSVFQNGGFSNSGLNLQYGMKESLKYAYADKGLISTVVGGALGAVTSAAMFGVAMDLVGTAAFGTLGSMIGMAAGPVGLLVSGIFSGLNALFSGGYRRVEQQGVFTPEQSVGALAQGAFTAQQFNVIKTRQWDMLTDSTDYTTVMTPLNDKLKAALGDVFSNVGAVSIGLAKVLGNGLEEQIKTYVMPSLRIDLKGLNAEEANKKLTGVINTAIDTMLGDVFGKVIGQYQQAGEGLLETATRLASQIVVVKDALAQSGLTITGDAIAISNALAQAAGGLEQFQSQFATYYDKFYSDTEKQTRLQTGLSEQLKAVNSVLPTTREGYRQLVESLDISNAKDQERYSLLLKLSDAADQYYSALENGLKTYQDALMKAFDTASGLLQKQIDTAKGLVNQWQQFSNSLLTGNLSTASPQAQYAQTKAEFNALRETLATGNVQQRADARAQLQTVAQNFLTQSRSFNASGMGYIKDFATVQGVLANQISIVQGNADKAQSQLDVITEQVKAQGLLNETITTSTKALENFNKALADLTNAAVKQTETQNLNAFASQEASRRTAYEAAINASASSYQAQGGRIEGMVGWSANASKTAFSASGSFTPGGDVLDSVSASGTIASDLKNTVFPRLSDSLARVASHIQGLVGGQLPNIALKFGDSESYGAGFAEYAFGDKKGRVNTDNLAILQAAFANDVADYLAGQLTDKTLSDAVKAVDFSRFSTGLAELYRVTKEHKNPFIEGVYDPDKNYIDGSHAAGLGFVPFDGYRAELHKGERVLTANDNKDIPKALEKIAAELAQLKTQMQEQNRHAAANVQTDQAGFKQMIAKLEQQIEEMQRDSRKRRIGESA